MTGPYPPGVTGQEDHFYDDEALCACGHSIEEHTNHGACEHEMVENPGWPDPQTEIPTGELCPCAAYEPEGAYS